MRQIIINAICGGVLGYCLAPGWQAVAGMAAMAILVVNTAVR